MTSSSATVRVEKATSDLLIGPDWTMNIDICDSINTEHWQAKDVVKAVKKRLQHKNPRVQFLALTLLETMIKNCGDYVHSLVVEREILQEMTKIVRKKTDMQVRDKILVLLDSWQEAFGGPGGKYPQYYWAYNELKRSGVEFPQISLDSALIFTTPAPHPAPPPRLLQIGSGMPSNSSSRLDEAMASEMANLSLSDLERYRGVMELLNDMLKAVDPGDREAIKDEVIVDLVSQCRSNQKKLMQLVSSTGDEVLLGQALELNDDFQNVLAKHDAIAFGSPLPTKASGSILEPSSPITPAPAPAIAATNQYEDDEDEDEDDDFTQLARRNSKYKQTASETSQNNEPNATTGSTSDTSSSSIATNALSLPNPLAPIKTSNKEQDMIDLLSLNLSSNPSPTHTPVTPASFQNSNPSISPNLPGSPYSINQNYVPYNAYVAPWSQNQPQQQLHVPQIQSSYPPPPWEANSSANANPYVANTHSSGSYVPPQPVSRPQPQQQYNRFGSPMNSNFRQTGYGSSPKPYIPANKMFEELIDMKTAERNVKSSSASSPTLSSSPNQGMTGERK